MPEWFDTRTCLVHGEGEGVEGLGEDEAEDPSPRYPQHKSDALHPSDPTAAFLQTTRTIEILVKNTLLLNK